VKVFVSFSFSQADHESDGVLCLHITYIATLERASIVLPTLLQSNEPIQIASHALCTQIVQGLRQVTFLMQSSFFRRLFLEPVSTCLKKL